MKGQVNKQNKSRIRFGEIINELIDIYDSLKFFCFVKQQVPLAGLV